MGAMVRFATWMRTATLDVALLENAVPKWALVEAAGRALIAFQENATSGAPKWFVRNPMARWPTTVTVTWTHIVNLGAAKAAGLLINVIPSLAMALAAMKIQTALAAYAPVVNAPRTLTTGKAVGPGDPARLDLHALRSTKNAQMVDQDLCVMLHGTVIVDGVGLQNVIDPVVGR